MLSSVEDSLIYLLREATMATRAGLHDPLAELGLTLQDLTALHLLGTVPGNSPAELARLARVSPQAMHKLVTELGRRRLLTLRPRPGHGRILQARLTAKGEQLRTEAEARVAAVGQQATAGLTPQQRRQLLDLLQHCVSALDASAGECEPGAEPRHGGPRRGRPSR